MRIRDPNRGDVRARLSGNLIYISFNYSEELVARVKSIPGKRWYNDFKYWTVPTSSWRFFVKELGSFVYNLSEIESKLFGIPSIEMHVNGKPYDYQTKGAGFLVSRKRALLADDMGLGKTLQSIAACEHLIRTDSCKKILVVCPNSTKRNWFDEIKMWTGKDAVVIAGGKLDRQKQYGEPFGYRVINYEAVRNPWDFGFLSQTDYDIIIIDEAQRIKNWTSQTSRKIKELNCKYAFALSGTPLENSPDELYSVCGFLDPMTFGGWKDFERRYIVKNRWGGVEYYRNLQELHTRIDPIMLRRKKEEVLKNLPPVYKNIFRVSLNSDEQKAYSKIHDDYMELPDSKVLPAMRMLQHLCNDVRLARDTDAEHIQKMYEFLGSPDFQSSKLKEFKTVVDELFSNGTKKIVIFSESSKMIDIIEREIKRNCLKLVGATPEEDRQKSVKQFNTDPAVQVFLTNKAGEAGINLTSADHVLHYDAPWNPARLEQRIARCHRIGQENPVHSIHFMVENSLDERVYEVLNEKQKIFDQVVDGFAEETQEKTFAERLRKLEFGN